MRQMIMNENPTPPRETESDASLTTHDDARVLAPPINAPRADPGAPFFGEQQNAARFDDELSSAVAPAENSAPTFGAVAPDEFSSPNATQFTASQAATPDDFSPLNDTRLTAPQNFDAPNSTPQNPACCFCRAERAAAKRRFRYGRKRVLRCRFNRRIRREYSRGACGRRGDEFQSFAAHRDGAGRHSAGAAHRVARRRAADGESRFCWRWLRCAN